MYSLHTTIYATYKLQNIIKHAVYSTVKLKLTAVHHRLLGSLHPFPFHQLYIHRLNKCSKLILERGILLPVPC